MEPIKHPWNQQVEQAWKKKRGCVLQRAQLEKKMQSVKTERERIHRRKDPVRFLSFSSVS